MKTDASTYESILQHAMDGMPSGILVYKADKEFCMPIPG